MSVWTGMKCDLWKSFKDLPEGKKESLPSRDVGTLHSYYFQWFQMKLLTPKPHFIYILLWTNSWLTESFPPFDHSFLTSCRMDGRRDLKIDWLEESQDQEPGLKGGLCLKGCISALTEKKCEMDNHSLLPRTPPPPPSRLCLSATSS